ncbi:WD40 repeat-like protein [Lojkania enalia]|uniref:WD40 repeat-like protein n=1 Tax=Lojkania enalia TaxID=147567 RepID=A0A9P4JXM8_9PLEO|nr:WD40 repeat-like protein [Didymosphaeria enalia]
MASKADQECVFFPPKAFQSESHDSSIYSMALTTSYLVTASRDQTIRVWSLETQRLAYPPLKAHVQSVLCVLADESLDIIFSGSVDGRIIIWRLSTGEIVRIIEIAHSESVLCMAISSSHLVTGSKDKSVKIWDLVQITIPNSKEEVYSDSSVATLNGHTAAVNGVAISESSIVTGSGDRTIRIWDIETQKCVRTIPGHEKGIAALGLSPDGSKIVSGSSDETLRIFDIQTGDELSCLMGHSNLVRSLCIVVGDGLFGMKYLISGGYDESVVVWTPIIGVANKWEIVKKFKVSKDLAMIDENPGTVARVFKVLCDGKRVFCANQGNFAISWPLP